MDVDKGDPTERPVPPTLAYARAIAARFVGQPTRDELLADLTKAVGRQFREGIAVLKQNPEFDVTDKAVDLHFHGAKALDEKPREQLKTLARLLRLAPDGDMKVGMVAELHKMGVHSGLQIMRMGKLGFLKHFENMEDMWQRLAVTVYCRASRIADGVAATRGMLAHNGIRDQAAYEDMAAALPAVEISTGKASPPGQADDPLSPPDLQSLFGPMDSCACTHCQSVFSPSAYLYNMLHWMRSDVQGAWDVLEQRRPDFKLLKLSCLNSDRMLPYIDLVNETLCLERQGAFDDPSEVYGGLSVGEEPNVETTWDEDLLRIQPQYRYAKAEDDIKGPSFPTALPFDRSEAEGYAAFAAAGVSLAPFLAQHHARQSTTPADGELAAAELGIPTEVAKLLLDTYHSSAPNDFWNQHTGRGSAPGKKIAHILESFDIDIDMLKRLAKLQTISDGSPESVVIEFDDDTCSWDSARFKTVPSFGLPLARLTLSILRLADILDEEIEDIDRALVAFNASTSGCVVNAEFLEFLAAVKRVEEADIATRDELYSYLDAISLAPSTDKQIVFAETFAASGTTNAVLDYFKMIGAAPFERGMAASELWPQIRNARAFASAYRFPDRLPQSEPAIVAADASAALRTAIDDLALAASTDPVPAQVVFAKPG